MRRYLLGALIGAAVVTSGSAATHRVPEDESIAQIDFPENWPAKTHDEFIEAVSPSGGVHVLVTAAEGTKVNESMGEIMRHVRDEGGIVFKSETIQEKPITINGNQFKTVSWEGKDQKGAVKITFTILPMPGRSPLLFACWASPQEEQKNQPVIRKMLESIRKI